MTPPPTTTLLWPMRRHHAQVLTNHEQRLEPPRAEHKFSRDTFANAIGGANEKVIETNALLHATNSRHRQMHEDNRADTTITTVSRVPLIP